MKQLDLNGCTTNKEVTDKIKEHVSQFNLEDIQKDLSKDFVYQQDSIRIIYTALKNGNNAILHGPGGFGKSVIVKRVCEHIGIPIIYKVGYEGMTAEELLGVPNMQKLLNDSTYEVAFENSVFAKPGILILEEFLDTGTATAAALKDILTEGGFREGDTKKESLISSIFITGNKDPKDLSKDKSTAAFYKERFPHELLVVWDRFTEDRYLDFFRVYFKEVYKENFNKFHLLAKLCVNTEEIVSPRIAAAAGKVMINSGIEFLDTISGIDTSELDKWAKESELESKLYTEKEILDNVNKHIDNLSYDDTLEGLVRYNINLTEVQLNLKLHTFSEENIPELKSTLKALTRLKGVCYYQMKKKVSVDDIIETINNLITHD